MNWIEYARNRPRMMPEGSGSSGIFCMGEALGEREEIDRLPFRPFAPAGSLFDRALRRAGIARSSLTISNVVWYRPPDNWLAKAPWEFEAIAHSRPLNNALIEKVNPKVIVALGGIAFRELTGLQGDKLGILNTRGFIVPSSLYPGIPVIGAIHPSAMRRGSKERNSNESSRTEAPGGGTIGMSLLGVLIRDLRLAQIIAKEGPPDLLKNRDHRLGATMDDWRNAIREAKNNPQLIISYDFETWKSLEEYDESETETEITTPTQFQISLRKNHALVSPWSGELLGIIREFMELPNPKLDWNGRGFDRRLLRDLVVRTDIGTWHDGMDLWHHAQPDIPKGLQFAASFACPEFGPWKHLAFSDPLFYGALDVDAPQWIWDFMQNLREKRHPISQVSLWTGYETQVVEVAPVLDGMSARGIPVDEEKRQELDLQFTAQLEQMNAESQSFFPDQLRNLHPKKGYKRTPKDTTGMQQRTVWDTESKKSTALVPFVRWCKLEPFLMSSPQQVMRYLKWKEYDIPHHPKTDKETTDELSLRKLITKHKDPLLIRILDYREIAKARSGYVLKWKPGEDGRVHPFFGFGPATGQLNSKDPNAQNFPKHAEIARIMRRMIRTEKRFISFDWKSFHVLTLGFEAQDASYMRMARLDMHSFFALVGLLRLEQPEKVLSLNDAELMDKLSWYRKQTKTYPQFACTAHPGGMTFGEIRDERAKRAILGVGFGQTGPGLYKRNPESFGRMNDAIECIKMLNRVFPLPEAWRGAVRLEADRFASLMTRYGYIRWFWDVFSKRLVSWDYQPRGSQKLLEDSDGRRWLIEPGDDHEACVAYRPANDAFGIKRSVIAELGRNGFDERFGLIDEIHDDLTFECAVDRVDECIPTVKHIMERPSLILSDPLVAPHGLSCSVEVSIGQNWDFKDSQNPIGMEKIKV